MQLAPRVVDAWRARGPLASSLWPLSLLYGSLVDVRRAMYRLGWLSSWQSPVPVIVVGNRVAGGAGKTPTTIALLRELQAAGRRPGVVSRGYGRLDTALREVDSSASPSEVGDEPLLIQLRSRAPVVVAADRVAAAQALLQRHPQVDVIVCDDGLQHLRLRRDVELVVFDERGAGNGWLLPAGPLREPLNTPPAARHVFTLYNAPAPSTALPGSLARRCIAGLVPLAQWWRGEPADAQALDALRGKPVVACAALAHPQRFFGMLRALGLEVIPLTLPDHDAYAGLPWTSEARDVVVTEKDAVKLDPQRLAHERPASRVWVAPLDFHLPADLVREILAALDTTR